MRLFIVAGEPSGDQLGAELIDALRILGPVELAGVGGEALVKAGLESLFDPSSLAIVGIVEAVPKIPMVWRRVQETVAHAIAFKPDVVVTIDSPSFSLEVAERLRRRLPGVKLVHYAAPQVWAWKAWRAKAMAGYLDHLMALLPFEPPFFDAHGLPTTFVGHPIATRLRDPEAGAAFRTRHRIASNAPVLCLLPGSRRGEVRYLLPTFERTLSLLRERYPDLVAVVPTLSNVAGIVSEAVSRWPVRTIVAMGEDRVGLFEAANAALTASGTVTLELAAAELPMVVTYRVSALTAAIVRQVVKVEFAALPNLIMERAVVPELLQDQATPANLANAVIRLLEDDSVRARQIADLGMTLVRLGRGGDPPALRAARVVMTVANQGTANELKVKE
jgi:lipid-A-disaccharide synthase